MAKVKKEIIFLNDKEIYNTRYRAELMRDLGNLGFNVKSKNSSLWNLLNTCLSSKIIVGSNLKTNIKLLVFGILRKKIIIINGLGRYRSIYLMRLMICLFKSQIGYTKIIIQNYADYRYFRLSGVQQIFWVCGSGGLKRVVNGKGPFIITREDKLFVTETSISELTETFINEKINVVGVAKKSNLETKFPNYTFLGYLNQDDIIQGDMFICPKGYGEGFPHTLADAICSNCIVIIDINDFIYFGIFLHQNEYRIEKKCVTFKPEKELIDFISVGNINEKYIKQILSLN